MSQVQSVPDSEVINWAKEHPIFKKYLGNIEALRVLYRTLVLGVEDKGVRPNYYPRMSVSDLRDGSRASLQGVVTSRNVREYEGCAVCRRKNCTEHGGAFTRLKLLSFVLADNSGSIRCVTHADDVDVMVGDEVVVYGRTRVFRESLEFSVDRLERVGVGGNAIDLVVSIVRKSGRLKRAVVESMCRRLGIKWEDVESKLVVDGDEVRTRG